MTVHMQAMQNGAHALLGAEIFGGFLEGGKLEFTSGLNCIIGGRGTGKTTILEFIRYTLGLMPDQKRSNRSRAHSVVQNNLANGRVRLEFMTKHGMRYTAERPWNDTCQVLDENGEATTISMERDLIFRADVYSQNEIEQIATNTDFQLTLIDQFEEENILRINGEISRLLRNIEFSAGEIHQLDLQIRDLTETVSEAPAIDEKLKGFQQTGGPDASLVNTAHAQKALRAKEQQSLSSLRKEIDSLATKFTNSTESLIQRLIGHLSQDLIEGPNQDIFQSAGEGVREFNSEFRKVVPKVVRQCKEATTLLADLERDLDLQHAKQEQAYRDLIAKSVEEQGRAEERARLQKRHLEVTEAKNALESIKEKHGKGVGDLRKMTKKLSILRDERFQLRKGVADRLSNSLDPTIRVTMTQAGDLQAYSSLLATGLKGSGLKYASIVEKIVQSVSPEELAVILQLQDVERLVDMTNLDAIRSARVIDILHDGGFIAKLEIVELADLPCIELLDGRDYKDARTLSTGQRCTTILPILLMESERPLLIDQPEDNLDNAFIFETIVKSVKAAKAKRQLIFVTHNPNIPVLGEADRVFVLSSDGRHGTITHSGTVDQVKDQIDRGDARVFCRGSFYQNLIKSHTIFQK
jgi:ABC-type lipoprotein export system ATPase subunit